MPSIYGIREYFERFPLARHSGRNVVNLSRRVAFLREVKNDPVFVGNYTVRDGETPWTLAQDFYGSPDYHWVIVQINDIVDPILDWPKGREEFDRYVDAKYGDDRSAPRYWVLDDREFSEDPGDPSAHVITNEDHEEIRNESMRAISILRPEYLGRALQEFDSLIRVR